MGDCSYMTMGCTVAYAENVNKVGENCRRFIDDLAAVPRLSKRWGPELDNRRDASRRRSRRSSKGDRHRRGTSRLSRDAQADAVRLKIRSDIAER